MQIKVIDLIIYSVELKRLTIQCKYILLNIIPIIMYFRVVNELPLLVKWDLFKPL